MGELFRRQLKTMLRKNLLLKIRHPFVSFAEVLLPTVVMLMLIAVRTRVDTTIHPAQPYIRKGMFVEVGSGDLSPGFTQILQSLLANEEYIAFAPDTEETSTMIDLLSLKFPLLKDVSKVYKSELELESYIRSDIYGAHDQLNNSSNPKIRGAVVFHGQGPQLFDYSIRLNHTWAFSGFPDVKSIMDTNGPYLNDLELGVNIVPTLQYGFSGFLTLQQILDSFIIFVAQQTAADIGTVNIEMPVLHRVSTSSLKIPWTRYSPSHIRIVPFPTREYTDDEFQSIIKTVMGILYILGFLYPVSRLISYYVFEKEQKIREGLCMMGLKDEVFHISWLLIYSLQFAISAAIITVSAMSSLFKYSDKSLVFAYFFVFGISAIMLSFLISTFFSRAKTAVAVGTLSFLGAFFPYYTVNDPSISMIFKILASLLSPTAFALGSINFADYERAHVGLRWSNMWRASSGVNFLLSLLMMVFDSLLYCALGLYCDKVLRGENGTRNLWNYLFQKCSLKTKSTKVNLSPKPEVSIRDSLLKDQLIPYYVHTSESSVESISLEMKQQELDGRCIQIRNLHKEYTSRKGNCCAVNSLQLTLYENQILALLGHNGAGKSTTISMLVGLLPPTSGDALVFGKNITTEMVDVRKILGVCPQHDILFPELTVREHLELFGILKGVEEDILPNTVSQMVDEVGLADKHDTVVRALSGGMKRKLSLAIALIGNSKVIVLDEPTSGMDPYSMRLTWQLIKKFKKGRIILLTTHSMDEADVLGDRIAILAGGSLKCCGSSMFLKHQYGVGYTLTLVKSAPTVPVAADIVYRHIPSAICVSEVGTEISFKLPLSSSSSFESMFREIESQMGTSLSCSNSENNGLRCGRGIDSYGISVTTLEEVFLRVAGCDYERAEPIEPESSFHNNDIVSKRVSCDKLLSYYERIAGLMACTIARGFRIILAAILGFWTFVNLQCCSCCFVSGSTFLVHFKALYTKRLIMARRDRKTIIFQLLIPAVFLFFGLLLLTLKPHPDQQSVTFTTSHFNPLLGGGGGGGPIPFDLSSQISIEVAEYVKGGWIQRYKPTAYKFPNAEKALADANTSAGPSLGPVLLFMSEYLMSSLNKTYESRYGAVVMDDQNPDGSVGYTVLHNSSCQHAAPTYINVVNAAILRLATCNKNMTLQARNHPLPMTKSQHMQRHDLDAFSAAVIVNIAFSFIPASFAVSLVKEREVKAKHQQLISGVSIYSYWISTYTWDFISFLFPSSIAMMLFHMFGLDQFIGRGRFFPTALMFIEYGLAIASSTYCLTFFFSDHTMAQNVVLLVHFFSGLVLMVISFIMGIISSTSSTNSFLKHFFRLSPGFCFADGLASLALLRQGMKDGSNDSVLDWNVTGASLSYLGIESVAYFLLALMLEQFQPSKFTLANLKNWLMSKISACCGNPHCISEPLAVSERIPFDPEEDIDVQMERNRVLTGSATDSLICLRNLRKVYPGGKIAVHSLTFSVKEGECFGFLGTNGAGKTTTLSMLSGEEFPSEGTATIFGKDIRSHPKAARKHIGYCPQFDALLDYLTVKEHLQLYARIKGVSEKRMEDVVMEKIVEFDLLKHADKPSFCLSGGNKRKLSVAVAMIGDPPIVILDEPSTGMDPLAKRFMWEVISHLSTRRGKTAVILTTHSMNEAQALCTRIGIMVGGKLRCLGSPQHLKTRYGNHLELEIKPTEITFLELESLSHMVKEKLLGVSYQRRGILGDLEACIGVGDLITSENASVAEITMTPEMISIVGNWLGNKDRVDTLINLTSTPDGILDYQLSEQLIRDGGIPLPVFSEWWLSKEKLSVIDSFINLSFSGATSQSCNGLVIKYQLQYEESLSLADVFGCLERNRYQLGIAEYSISQSTLETIFNHFAANA
ncbi:unnamed protein product [Rhodiola kirilowii]